jgi:hypothetical protein
MFALGVPVGGVEQRRARRIKKFRCLSPQGEFLNFPSCPSSAEQPRRGRRIRGALFFAYFLLGKQKKVSALSGAHPDAVHRMAISPKQREKSSVHGVAKIN